MPRPLTDEEQMHACLTCRQMCDCDEHPDECRGCWYCTEEQFDRDIRESESEES